MFLFFFPSQKTRCLPWLKQKTLLFPSDFLLHHGKLTMKRLIFFLVGGLRVYYWLFWYNVNKSLLEFYLFHITQKFPEASINIRINLGRPFPYWVCSLLFQIWDLKHWFANVPTSSNIAWISKSIPAAFSTLRWSCIRCLRIVVSFTCTLLTYFSF